MTSASLRIDPDVFLPMDFESRLREVARVAGGRLDSNGYAGVWRALFDDLLAACAPDTLLHPLGRQALRLAPYAPDAERILRALYPLPDLPDEPVVLVISCARYFDKAARLHARLAAAGADAYIVVGDPAQPVSTLQERLLVVPADDGYQALPFKVMEALVAVRRHFGCRPVLKVDDDLTLVDERRLVPALEGLARVEYAGNVLHDPHSDRCWHLGKLGQGGYGLPYGKRHVGAWASGVLYHLSCRAVRELGTLYTRFPGELAGEEYEDMAVGKLLLSLGMPPTPLDIFSLTGLKPDYTHRLA